MLPPKMIATSPEQQKLLRLFRQLTETDRSAVINFAAFLVERSTSEEDANPEDVATATPQSIPRPEQETVIGAIRRLTATYPMVEKDDLLHKASGLMSAHVMQGKAAVEVIDELEIVFRRHFERVNSDT